MNNSCLYCAQMYTKKDAFGYCKVYNCFDRSGKKVILDNLVKEAFNLIFISNDFIQLSIMSHVSNFYNKKTRAANDIMYKAKKEFGFIPSEVLKNIDMKNRQAWDKNIRW